MQECVGHWGIGGVLDSALGRTCVRDDSKSCVTVHKAPLYDFLTHVLLKKHFVYF